MLCPFDLSMFQEIYKKGGRKFALINLGPLGCLQDLESKLKGFKYSFSNFYALLEERMNNPSKYGMPSPPPYHMFFPVAKFYLCYNSPLRCRCKGFKEGKIEYAVQVLTEDAQAVGGREE